VHWILEVLSSLKAMSIPFTGILPNFTWFCFFESNILKNIFKLFEYEFYYSLFSLIPWMTFKLIQEFMTSPSVASVQSSVESIEILTMMCEVEKEKIELFLNNYKLILKNY
jgi:hypothetical protein